MATNFTPDMLAALEEAFALGATKVKYADKEVEYETTDNLLKRIEIVRKALGGKKPRGARIYMTTSKDLNNVKGTRHRW